MSDERCEGPYERAARQGRESGQQDGDWRDNPFRPGTREWFEFSDAQDEAKKNKE